MKRGLSFITACTLMMTFILSLFSGCSINANAADKMIVSEWLYLINQKFGFSEYTETKPYISNITPENESFDDVQTAFEYSVLPEGYTALKLDDELTREFCAITLSGAIYIANDKEINICDYNSLMFPESVKTVINEGIMSLDESGNFNPQKVVSYSDAIVALDAAYHSWAFHKFDTVVDYTLSANVVDLGGLSTIYTYEDSAEVTNYDADGNATTTTEVRTNYAVDNNFVEQQRKWLSDNNFEYNGELNLVTIDDISDKNISEGSVLTIPDSLEYPTGLYLKVNKIGQNQDGKYELEVSPAAIDDVFDGDVDIALTKQIDFSQCVIYDADGNILSEGKYSNDNEETAANMSFMNTDATLSMKLEKDNIPLPGGLKGKLTAKDGSITLSVSNEEKQSGGSNTYTKETDTTELSVEFKNMVCTACETENFKNLWGKDTGIINPMGYHKLSLSYDTTIKGSLSYKWEDDDIDKDKNSLGLVMSGQFTKALTKTTLNNKKIAAIPVYLFPGVAVELDLYMSVSLEGEVTFSFGFSDGTIVFESRKMKPSYSANWGRLASKSVSGSIKAEIAPQLNLCLAIVNVDVIDIEGKIGVGLKIEAKLTEVYDDHTAVSDPKELDVGAAAACMDLLNDPQKSSDEESQLLFCLDTTAYGILDFTFCSDKSIVGKALKLLGVKEMKIKIWDEESKKLVNIHFEGGTDTSFAAVPNCTLSDRIDGLIEHGDDLEISPLGDVTLEVGETKIIDITMLPKTKHKYYLTSDLETLVESDKIAVCSIAPENEDNSKIKFKWEDAIKKFTGKKTDEDELDKIKITGIAEGATHIIVRTKDDMYSIPLTVTVIPKEVEIKEYMIPTIESFFASTTVGDTTSVNILKVPEGQAVDNVFWESDDESIAYVDRLTGEITGVSSGECTVKAYISGYEDSGVYCLVSISDDYSASLTAFGLDASSNHRMWIKTDGLPVMIVERA